MSIRDRQNCPLCKGNLAAWASLEVLALKESLAIRANCLNCNFHTTVLATPDVWAGIAKSFNRDLGYYDRCERLRRCAIDKWVEYRQAKTPVRARQLGRAIEFFHAFGLPLVADDLAHETGSRVLLAPPLFAPLLDGRVGSHKEFQRLWNYLAAYSGDSSGEWCWLADDRTIAISAWQSFSKTGHIS